MLQHKIPENYQNRAMLVASEWRIFFYPLIALNWHFPTYMCSCITMGDSRVREGNRPEKVLFTIPSAKEIARLEHGKSKVKSYFRSHFGNRLSASQSRGQGPSTEQTSSRTVPPSTENLPSSKAASAEANTTVTGSTGSTPHGNIEVNGRTVSASVDGDPKVNSSSASVGMDPSTCGMRGEAGMAGGNIGRGAKRKIGSAFADKFSALRDESDYEEPMAKRPAVSTAVVAAPITTAAKAPSGTNTIIVNTRQRGNPILKHIRNVPWEYGDIVPDYVMGRTACTLFLSLRYHHLNPNYIHDRLKDLGHHYELRVLLVQVDVKDPHHSVKELARMALMADCTLILAWSAEEAGRYLETYKSYENKSADALKEKIETDYLSKVTDVLGTVKSVNKTDAVTLISTFGGHALPPSPLP
ncbi:DNA excision repair protein ERCC-1-like isoform X2 [Acanthaster planci]|uniref:DNA excision repair protein ERCC-1-like isoform X2 n=1 Tax=Acanthaster planci TaxID=133434 RepID=A0A8B7ZCC1_ACAPL|nr:DNA excision repair protein ERCC-1-like isoform X2 [Acanthaster planci]